MLTAEERDEVHAQVREPISLFADDSRQSEEEHTTNKQCLHVFNFSEWSDSGENVAVTKGELSDYLSMESPSCPSEVLVSWKNKQQRYPKLARLAKKMSNSGDECKQRTEPSKSRAGPGRPGIVVSYVGPGRAGSQHFAVGLGRAFDKVSGPGMGSEIQLMHSSVPMYSSRRTQVNRRPFAPPPIFWGKGDEDLSDWLHLYERYGLALAWTYAEKADNLVFPLEDVARWWYIAALREHTLKNMEGLLQQQQQQQLGDTPQEYVLGIL
ncbi:hypothetical protein HPB50_018213 [Hyalomma asiaticum]|uniref:Uncharacterized protein n=1 Tax=Hyalomma asiaticum TaxID=266040 RepID=A0ACB7SJ36_HYAAI|nr:hypothetical protein HPB50_018213 [Hyalomma asiaticum]